MIKADRKRSRSNELAPLARFKSQMPSAYPFGSNQIAEVKMRVAHQFNEWRKIYWHRLYSFVSYSKSALWIIPLIAIPIVMFL